MPSAVTIVLLINLYEDSLNRIFLKRLYRAMDYIMYNIFVCFMLFLCFVDIAVATPEHRGYT